jgi:hypothetical protein
MRDYAQLRPRFWTQGTGKELRGDREAREMAVYLMSSPSSNLIGLYYLPLITMTHELGYDSVAAARTVLARLEAIGFALYDEPSEYVWVVNMCREQVGDDSRTGDNRIKGVVNELRKHTRNPFYSRFYQHYATAYDFEYSTLPNPEAPSKPSEAPPKPLRRASAENVTPPESGSGSGTGSGTDIGGDAADAAGSVSEPGATRAKGDPVFDHWVMAMGKRSGTKLNSARRGKLKARRSEGFTDTQLCEAIDGCKLSDFHMGANERGEVYNDLETILRNGSTVEKHRERLLAGGRPRSPPQPRQSAFLSPPTNYGKPTKLGDVK